MSAKVSRALRVRPRLSGAAKDDPQPGDDLFEAERLGHVVVAAQRSARRSCPAGNPGRSKTVRGRRCRRRAAAAAPRSRPCPASSRRGSPRRAGLARPIQRSGAVGCRIDLEPLKFQTHREQLDDVGFVVDDEDASLRFRVSWGLPLSSDAHVPYLNVCYVKVVRFLKAQCQRTDSSLPGFIALPWEVQPCARSASRIDSWNESRQKHRVGCDRARPGRDWPPRTRV